MKKILLFACILCFGLSTSAQISVPEEYKTIAGSPDDVDFDHHFTVINETNGALDVYWELILEDGFPEEWETFLCDRNLCYTKFVRNCPESMVNAFDANEEFYPFILHVKPEGVEGEGTLCIRFHIPQSTGDSISVDHCFDILATSNDVTEIAIEEITIFPNPTTDYFQIKADEGIRKVGIYNVVGKLIKEVDHTQGQTHNVETLNKGIYLIRLIDDNNQIVKTMKLSKR